MPLGNRYSADFFLLFGHICSSNRLLPVICPRFCWLKTRRETSFEPRLNAAITTMLLMIEILPHLRSKKGTTFVYLILFLFSSAEKPRRKERDSRESDRGRSNHDKHGRRSQSRSPSPKQKRRRSHEEQESKDSGLKKHKRDKVRDWQPTLSLSYFQWMYESVRPVPPISLSVCQDLFPSRSAYDGNKRFILVFLLPSVRLSSSSFSSSFILILITLC